VRERLDGPEEGRRLAASRRASAVTVVTASGSAGVGGLVPELGWRCGPGCASTAGVVVSSTFVRRIRRGCLCGPADGRRRVWRAGSGAGWLRLGRVADTGDGVDVGSSLPRSRSRRVIGVVW
jgi:hypothetical protein